MIILYDNLAYIYIYIYMEIHVHMANIRHIHMAYLCVCVNLENITKILFLRMRDIIKYCMYTLNNSSQLNNLFPIASEYRRDNNYFIWESIFLRLPRVQVTLHKNYYLHQSCHGNM